MIQSRSLEGRIALITGASRGIGAAISKRYAAEGAPSAAYRFEMAAPIPREAPVIRAMRPSRDRLWIILSQAR